MKNSDTPIQLYKHQADLLDRNPPRYGIFHSTGVGKTITGIYLANKNCMSVLVIVPKTNKQDWIDNMSSHCLCSEWTVLTKEEFKKQAPKLPAYDGVIVDECFTGDTRVQTPSGRIPIKDLRVGGTVINAFGVGIIKNIGIKQVDKILKIKLSDGSIISVTENHPLLTNKGWSTAGKLQKGSVLLHYLHVHDILNVYEKDNLCNLRERNSEPFTGEDKESVRSCLSGEINLEKQQRQNDKFLNKFILRQLKSSEDVIREDEEKQPNVKSGYCFKDEGNTKKNWIQTKSPWWQRARNAISTKNSFGSAWNRMVCGTCYKNKKNNGFSKQLQNRYCKSSINDCDRGGWVKPLKFREKTAGQEKGYGFREIRVESIQIQEQRSNKGITVYNLEVSGHPSYVVENILAHNCHYFFGIKSQMSKTLMAYFKKHNTPYRWLMTATPYLSTPLNIYVAGKLLGHEWNYAYFVNQFFYRINMGGRLITKPKPGMEDELAKLVRAIGETVDLGKLVTIPEQKYITHYMSLSPPQVEAIEKINDSTFITRWTKRHQIENGFLYDYDIGSKTEHFINDKIDWISKNIKNHPKTAIFCRYKEQITQYRAIIAFLYPDRQIFELHGDIKDRYNVIHDAESAENAVIIIQSQCSAGYELPSFNFIIFASLSFSYVDYKQALGRFLRINKLKENTFVHLVVDGVDRDVYDCIMRKEDFSLSLYKT